MHKILILYGSITGNTEATATVLHGELLKILDQAAYSIDIANLNSTEASKLLDYDVVLFGTSTWDENSNPDTEDFLIRLGQESPDLKGKHFGLFGLGDTAYPVFCGALPLAQRAFELCGALVSSDYFTIDGYPTDEIAAQLTAWAKTFIEQIS